MRIPVRSDRSGIALIVVLIVIVVLAILYAVKFGFNQVIKGLEIIADRLDPSRPPSDGAVPPR